MPSDLAYYLVFYVVLPLAYIAILGPFETLIHELGHAFTALFLTKQEVSVYLGTTLQNIPQSGIRRRLPVWIFSLGKITFYLKPLSGSVGTTEWEREARHDRWILLAGPAASLLVAAFFILTTYLLRSPTFSIWYFLSEVAAIVAVCHLILTLIPMRYPSWFGPYANLESDGYQVWHLLVNKMPRMKTRRR